jgi:hypothetical protein
VAGEDDDTAADGGRHAARICEQQVIEQRADALGDLAVRPQEDAQQVTPGNDADQPAVPADDRQPADVPAGHDLGRMRDRRFRVDGHRRGAHQCTRGEPPMRPAQRPAPPAGGVRVHPGPADLFILQPEQIGLGHHACDAAPHPHHGHATDPVLGEQADDIAERGEPVHRHDLCRHHVPDPGDMADRRRLPAVLPGPGPAYPHGCRGPAGSLPLPGLDMLLDRLERPGHVGACRPAVQGVVIRRTQVAERGIQVNISASHDR